MSWEKYIKTQGHLLPVKYDMRYRWDKYNKWIINSQPACPMTLIKTAIPWQYHIQAVGHATRWDRLQVRVLLTSCEEWDNVTPWSKTVLLPLTACWSLDDIWLHCLTEWTPLLLTCCLYIGGQPTEEVLSYPLSIAHSGITWQEMCSMWLTNCLPWDQPCSSRSMIIVISLAHCCEESDLPTEWLHYHSHPFHWTP